MILLVPAVLSACTGASKEDPVIPEEPVATVTAPPSGVTLSAATQTSLTFVWEAVPDVAVYTWTLSLDGAELYSGSTDRTQVTVPNLKCSETYVFGVRSVGVTVSGAVTASGTTMDLDAPTGLAVKDRGGRFLTLSWDALGELPTGFAWELTAPDGTAVSSGAQAENELTFSDLEPGGTYRFSLWNVRNRARSAPVVLDAETLHTKYSIETNLGRMTVLLYDDTPLHRDNFMELADKGYYSGVKFDRILSNLAQCGYTESGSAHAQQWGTLNYRIKGEVLHKHKRGSLSQAQWSTDQTSPMSFFFSRTDTGCTYLDATFTVYGEIVDAEGLETLEKFFGVPRSGETPREDIVIVSVSAL